MCYLLVVLVCFQAPRGLDNPFSELPFSDGFMLPQLKLIRTLSRDANQQPIQGC